VERREHRARRHRPAVQALVERFNDRVDHIAQAIRAGFHAFEYVPCRRPPHDRLCWGDVPAFPAAAEA